MSKPIHENAFYQVVVGIPPKTTDFPEPIEAYLVKNKQTGVIEYFHSVLFYAKQQADYFADLLAGKYDKEVEEAKEAQHATQRGLFN